MADQGSRKGDRAFLGHSWPQWTLEVRLTSEMSEAVGASGCGLVATASERGSCIVETTAAVLDDEHLVFAVDTGSATMENIWHQSAADVGVVDSSRGLGFRFSGAARAHVAGDRYARGLEILRRRGYPIEDDDVAVIELHVDRADPLGPRVREQLAAAAEGRARDNGWN